MRNQVEQARRGMSLTLLTTATQRLHFCRPLRHQSATGSIKRLPLDALDVALADHRPIRQKISQNNNGIIHRNGSAGIIHRNGSAGIIRRNGSAGVIRRNGSAGMDPPEWIRRNNPPEWIRRNNPRTSHFTRPQATELMFSHQKNCSVVNLAACVSVNQFREEIKEEAIDFSTEKSVPPDGSAT